MKNWLLDRFTDWLKFEPPATANGVPLTDMEPLLEEVRPADVILVEGRSRVSDVIKTVTNSPWTYAALYLGRLDEIKEGQLQNRIAEHYRGDPHQPLIVEAEL